MHITGQGLILMVVGLSVVFVFLAALILAMMASSKLFMRYAHLMPETPRDAPRPAADTTNQTPVIAAIAAALLARKG